MFALKQTPGNHGRLDRAKEQQCSSTGRKLEIGKRKGPRVGGKSEGGEPVSGLETPFPSHCHDKPECDRARKNANQGKGRGINAALPKSEATKDGVTGKSNHRQRRHAKSSGCCHLLVQAFLLDKPRGAKRFTRSSVRLSSFHN